MSTRRDGNNSADGGGQEGYREYWNGRLDD